MIQEKIVRDDLLYHSAHGLCQVNEVIKEKRAGKEVFCYSIVPKATAKMRVRFIIADSDMETSGFHPPISTKEANEILKYLKAQDAADSSENASKAARYPIQENHPWSLAKGILSFSCEDSEIKDQRKLQMLRRFAKGLVEELAFVLKISLKEMAMRIRKCLGSISKINPLVLDALERACAD